jgi:predicted nucleic acid-binding protein
MIVIADTGPVNYLILIGEIEILPAVFQRVLVPHSVCEELKRPRAPDAGQIARRGFGSPRCRRT